MIKYITLFLFFFLSIVVKSQGYSVSIDTDQGVIPDGELTLCAGTTITAIANVDYGSSGADPSLTEFEWTVDGNVVSTLSEFTFTFYTASTHSVQLLVHNPDMSLSSTDDVNLLISGAPNFENLVEENVNSMLLGEEVTLYSSLEEGELGFVFPPPLVVESDTEFGFTLFLPDGSGQSYETTISIASAPAGTTVGEDYEIPEIWAALEHSFLGDLDIELTCPNGNSVVLQDQGGGSCNLGFPWSTGPVDGESANTTLGSPLVYEWNIDGSENLSQSCGESIEFVSGDGPNTYLDSQAPAGIYAAIGEITNLLTCPINGDWVLTITDNIAADNGYVFAWGMSFDDGLVPPTVSPINVSLTDLEWLENIDITANNGGNINVAPDTPGIAEFTIRATDSFNCQYEHDLEINVIDPNSIEENTLDISIGQNNLNVYISFEDNEQVLVSVYDPTGKRLHESSFVKNHEVSMEKAGMYIFEFTDNKGMKSIKKVILQN